MEYSAISKTLVALRLRQQRQGRKDVSIRGQGRKAGIHSFSAVGHKETETKVTKECWEERF